MDGLVEMSACDSDSHGHTQPLTDEQFGHPSGRPRQFTEATPAITDETLTADIRHFKAATVDIHADTEWMQAMPEPVRLIAALTEERITELVTKVEGGKREIRIAEFDREAAAAWIPAELQEQLIKIVDRFYLLGLAAKKGGIRFPPLFHIILVK